MDDLHPRRAANSFVGSPVERREDLRFLRGRGQYVDDLVRDGMLHAVILRSPVGHGVIRSIDAAAAGAMPGVHSVITAAEIGIPVPKIPIRLLPLPELAPFAQPVIVGSRIRHVGEPIAIVLAQTAAQAEDALDGIALDIQSLPAVTDRKSAEADETLLYEEHGTNRAITYRAAIGDAGAAFRDAPYTRREYFQVQRHTAVPMEPRGLLAEWDAASGRLTVSGAVKVPFANRAMLAAQLGLAEDAVEMVENDAGGSFGARGEFFPEDFLIPFAARYAGRPVIWCEDRRENLVSLSHARECECELEIACRRDGTILGMRGHAYTNIGAYIRTNGLIQPRNVAQFLTGPYRVANVDIDTAVLLTNKTPAGTYRGPGRFEGDFFRERLFDMAAKDLGIDRVEFRRRNLVSKEEMPYKIATISSPERSEELDSGDYRLTLDRCLADIDWAGKEKLQGKLVDGRYHGLAVGCFVEGGAAGPRENARITLDADGAFSVYLGSSAVGQGVETVFAQIAADALEVPMERITNVFHGSTAYVAEGFGSYHSRSVVMGGSALLGAAAGLREAMRKAAATRLDCRPDQIQLSEDKASASGGRSVALTQIAADGLSVEYVFSNHKHTYAYGAHAAHIAVDPKTGHVELIDYVAIEDAGRIINPLTLHGQAVGAVVQGLGGAFLENLVYDEHGQFLTGSFADYLMPTASDFPNIRAVMLELHPSPNQPIGAKGAGEGGIVPVGGVIANAVAAALASFGVEPHVLPLSPPAIWQLLEDARTARGAAERR